MGCHRVLPTLSVALLGVLALGACGPKVPMHQPIVAYPVEPRPPGPIPAPDALPAEQSRAQLLLDCAENAIAAFNASEDGDPLALRKGRSCYAALGIYGHATRISLVLDESFPDQADERQTKELKAKAIAIMSDSGVARQTLWGQHCISLRGRSSAHALERRLACAKEGQFTKWVVELCDRHSIDSGGGEYGQESVHTCVLFREFSQKLDEKLAQDAAAEAEHGAERAG